MALGEMVNGATGRGGESSHPLLLAARGKSPAHILASVSLSTKLTYILTDFTTQLDFSATK